MHGRERVGTIPAAHLTPDYHDIRPLGEKKFRELVEKTIDPTTGQVLLMTKSLTRARTPKTYTTSATTPWVARWTE